MTILLNPPEWYDPNKVTAPPPLDDYLHNIWQSMHDIDEDFIVPIRIEAAPSSNVEVVTGYHPDRPDEPIAWWECDNYRVVLSEAFVRECYKEPEGQCEMRCKLVYEIVNVINEMYRHRWKKEEKFSVPGYVKVL